MRCLLVGLHLFNVVDHGHDVVVLWHQLVVRWDKVEAEEHEHSHEGLSIWSIALEAHVDTLAAQLLLGELQQRDKAVARALGQHG